MYQKLLILGLLLLGIVSVVVNGLPVAAAPVAQTAPTNVLNFLTGSNPVNLPACKSLFDISLALAKEANPGRPILWTFGVNFRQYESDTNGRATKIYPCFRIYLIDPSSIDPDSYWGNAPFAIDGSGIVTDPCLVEKADFDSSSIHIQDNVTISESSHIAGQAPLTATAAIFDGSAHLKCEFDIRGWMRKRAEEIASFEDTGNTTESAQAKEKLHELARILRNVNAVQYDNMALIAAASDFIPSQNLPSLYPIVAAESMSLSVQAYIDHEASLKFPVECVDVAGLIPVATGTERFSQSHQFGGIPVQYLWFNHRMEAEGVRRYTDYTRREVDNPVFQTCIADYDVETVLGLPNGQQFGWFNRSQDLGPLPFPTSGTVYIGYDPESGTGLQGTLYEIIVDPTDSQPPPGFRD